MAEEEIVMAFEKVISSGFSINYKDAITSAQAILGFRRITADTRKRAEFVLNERIARGQITRTGDFLILTK